MKKILFLLAIVTCIHTTSFAQFHLGVKAGANIAKLNSDFAKEENRLGYQVGAWARIGSGFYLQPEVYFGSKGNKFVQVTQDNGTEVTAEGTVKFTTLDIPLLFGTKFGADKLNFRVMGGPVISFNLDEKSTFAAAFNQATDFQNYKDQTFGLQAGAGIDIANFAVDLRYETGLSNISNSDMYKQKTSLWQLSLGFKLF